MDVVTFLDIRRLKTFSVYSRANKESGLHTAVLGKAVLKTRKETSSSRYLRFFLYCIIIVL